MSPVCHLGAAIRPVRCDGQVEAKQCAATVNVPGRDSAIVQLHDPLRDGQAQPRAGATPGPRVRPAERALKDPGKLVRADSATRIANADLGTIQHPRH